MANSFGDTISDFAYAKGRWETWQAEAERLRTVLADKERLAHRLAAECVERMEDQERLRAALIQIAGHNWSHVDDAVDMRRIAMVALASDKAR